MVGWWIALLAVPMVLGWWLLVLDEAAVQCHVWCSRLVMAMASLSAAVAQA